MANRRKTSDRLRGRELPPGTAPRSDFAFSRSVEDLVSMSSVGGSVLKGQFLPGFNQAEAGS